MYVRDETWTAKNVDFQQLAKLMMGYIEVNLSPHTVSPTLDHPFKRTLYEEGENTIFGG